MIAYTAQIVHLQDHARTVTLGSCDGDWHAEHFISISPKMTKMSQYHILDGMRHFCVCRGNMTGYTVKRSQFYFRAWVLPALAYLGC